MIFHPTPDIKHVKGKKCLKPSFQSRPSALQKIWTWHSTFILPFIGPSIGWADYHITIHYHMYKKSFEHWAPSPHVENIHVTVISSRSCLSEIQFWLCIKGLNLKRLLERETRSETDVYELVIQVIAMVTEWVDLSSVPIYSCQQLYDLRIPYISIDASMEFMAVGCDPA